MSKKSRGASNFLHYKLFTLHVNVYLRLLRLYFHVAFLLIRVSIKCFLNEDSDMKHELPATSCPKL
jgi:hypothetical protein